MVRAGPEVVGGGGATVEQWWWRGFAGSGELRRAWAGMTGSDNFTGGQGRRDDARPRQCDGGSGSSAWSRASPVMAEGAERQRRAFACVEAGMVYL